MFCFFPAGGPGRGSDGSATCPHPPTQPIHSSPHLLQWSRFLSSGFQARMTSPEPWVQRFMTGFDPGSYGLSWPDGDRGGLLAPLQTETVFTVYFCPPIPLPDRLVLRSCVTAVRNGLDWLHRSSKFRRSVSEAGMPF